SGPPRTGGRAPPAVTSRRQMAPLSPRRGLLQGNSRPFAGVSKRRAASSQQAATRLAFDTFDKLSAVWLVGRFGPTPQMARFRWPAPFYTEGERGTRNRYSTRHKAMPCRPAAIAC